MISPSRMLAEKGTPTASRSGGLIGGAVARVTWFSASALVNGDASWLFDATGLI
jgi:hypothetical protein